MLAHSGGGDFDKKGLVKRARASDEMERKRRKKGEEMQGGVCRLTGIRR